MTELRDRVEALQEDVLASWLVQQRWFGSKARELSHFGVLDLVPLRTEDPELAIAIIEARFQAGTHDVYQLLVGTGRSGLPIGESGLHDALGDPGEARILARLMADGEAIETSAGCVRFHWTGVVDPLPSGSDVRSMGAEQSNTSIVFGEEQVLKVFRRLEPGDNPELEMLRFLSERGFEHIAALAGWYEFTGDLMDATLGVLQRFVPGGRDGWELALDSLAGGDAETAFLERLRELGAITARMHSLLGSDATDPDFAPETPSAEALSLLSATIDEQIERTFRDLPEDDPELEHIRGRGGQIRDRLQLLSHASEGGKLIRHHGDFHLGQCLLGGDERWVLLDFEGEPARTLPERRRKRSPLRDVAGMLRSFAYAASAGPLLRGVDGPPDWEQRARSAFLDSYLETVEPALLPAGKSATDKLLAIFELEKAVYELQYELNNRPDWVAIPVAGILRILEADL